MERRDAAVYLLAVVGVLVVGAVLLVQSGAIYQLTDPNPTDYDRTTVTLEDANGTELATVDVRVADTDAKRYVGLSKTESLDSGDGMLFVYDGEQGRAYVMRNMSFALDIVFVAANGTVTTIHHAGLSDSAGDLKRHRGRGKWVLEVPRGYTNETGLDVGDRVEIPASS
jgi:uncharacterized membrane protein (UPF0127 family)